MCTTIDTHNLTNLNCHDAIEEIILSLFARLEC
jgi:hypothetical protein